MGTKYIHNSTAEVIYVGGKMIAPGEGRDIEMDQLPAEHQDAPAEAAPDAPSLDDDLQELRAASVKAISEKLSALTQEGLERLGELEAAADAPRKTLIEAIEAEKMDRAEALLDGEKAAMEMAAFEAELDAAYQAQLAEMESAARAALGEAEHFALRAELEKSLKEDKA